MTSPDQGQQAATALDASDTITINIKGHQTHEVNKQTLIKSSDYFRGMFTNGFKEDVTGHVELSDEGEHIREAFWILLQLFENGQYSMHDYLVEKQAQVHAQSDEEDLETIGMLWLAPMAFILKLHELWLDLFVLVDQYGSTEMVNQVVADISNILAIDMTLEHHQDETLLPYEQIHPITINAPKFRKMHYDRVVLRMEGTYPSQMDPVWMKAFHSFYLGRRRVEDNTLFKMATENKTLALAALPKYALLLNRAGGPTSDCLQVSDRELYEDITRAVMSTWRYVHRKRLQFGDRDIDEQVPQWYREWYYRLSQTAVGKKHRDWSWARKGRFGGE